MTKTNEDYMREIRNIQPAHPLVYERIEQILAEKDKEKEGVVAEAKRKEAKNWLEILEDLKAGRYIVEDLVLAAQDILLARTNTTDKQ